MEFEPDTPLRSVPAIDFRGALNDDQHAAVTAAPGPLLVLAGAGSGKTRTLTYRVAWLLAQGVRPSEILLLTFTNKAAKEMLARVEDLTGVDRLRFWGGTFHHIGNRILRMNADAAGIDRSFTILDEGDAEGLLRDVVERVDPGFFKDKTRPKPGPLLDILSLAANTRKGVAHVVETFYPQHEELIEKLEAFASAYREQKKRQQVCDYDDLLVRWLELLERVPEVREFYTRRFRHVLVDEYQDVNQLQADLVDRMAGHHNVMAVGDDAQCIYSWRGASFDSFVTFPDRHPGTRICRIEVNYRSSPQILSLANGVLQHQVERRGFEKTLRAARRAGERPYFVPTVDGREQAWFVTNRIRALQEDGRPYAEIAVLYRAHYQALELQLELTKLGIPFQITSGVRFFEQAHVRDVAAFLRVVNNPRDSAAWGRIAALLPKVGPKAAGKLHDEALAIAEASRIRFTSALYSDRVIARVPKDAKAEWDAFADTLKDAAEAAEQHPPSKAVELVVEGWYGDYVRGAFDNYQARLDDLQSLIGFAGRFPTLAELLAQVTLLSGETADRGLEVRGDAVRLTTVHQAKGLEFDVVFVIGLGEGMFPLRRAVESGDVEEERRLFYVAVTRAREELYLCAPQMSERPPMVVSPSRFLREIDPSLYQTLRLPRRTSW